MAIYKEDIVNIELSTGKIFRSFLEHTIGAGDELANRFGVRVFRNGVAENIGGTCMGLFIRADGTTVTISSGVVSGNVAYVTLPEACYAVEGQFSLAIKCQGSGVTGTLRIVDGVVSRTSTSAAVDPGTIIPSIEDLIEAINDAIASIPADYSSLQSPMKDVFVDLFDVNKFASDGSSYYSTDGYNVSVLAVDSRSESNILYRMPLRSGVKYAIVFDSMTYAATKFQIYDPDLGVFAYNSTANGEKEVIFTPAADGEYTIKLLTSGNSCTISNLRIVNYDLWRSINTIGVTPIFNPNYTDDENVTHAVYSAHVHGFNTVEVPYKEGGYTVETPIRMYSNVELKAAKDVLFTLADDADCQMVINANITTSDTHTDKNITVNGGTWDGNHDNQVKFTVDGQGNRVTAVVGMQFAGVDGLKIMNCRIQNARLYGALIGNSNDVVVDRVDIEVGDVNTPDNGDGLHFLGPVTNVDVINCRLRSEDNCLAFNADDADHGEYTTFGDIKNIYVNNLNINNYDGGQGILLLSSTHFIYNATIENVAGVGGYFLNLSNFGLAPNKNGIFHDVHVQNVIFEMYGNWQDAILMAGQFRNATFENLNFQTLNYRGNVTSICIIRIRDFANVPTYTDVRHLTVKDVFANVTTANKNLYLLEISSDCTIGEMRLSGLKSHNNIGTLYPVNITGAADINLLKVEDSIFNNAFFGTIYIRNEETEIETIDMSGIMLSDRFSPYKVLNPNGASIARFICRDALGSGYGVQDVDAAVAVYTTACIAQNSIPDIPIYFNRGQVIGDRTGETNGWICTKSGVRYTTTRQPSTEYAVNDIVMYGEYLLICFESGTTGSGEITPIETNAFSDGSCVWRVLYKGIAEFKGID